MKNFLLLFVLIGFAPHAAAQLTRPTLPGSDDKTTKGSIRGRVVMPGGTLIAESVRVSLLTVNGTQATVYSDNTGWFEFPDLVPGNYEVQVESNGTQIEVVSQSVQVFRGAPSIISISLRDKSTTRRIGNTPVSVSEFGADVPRSARKEFELASKAASENKSDQAVTHLRKAIGIYPNFVMARNDLGTQLLAQGKLEEAAEELRQAILIDDKAFNPKLNLGIVLVQEHKFTEAAGVLGQAITLNSQSPAARLYSGEAQMGLENLDAAEKDLKAAYSLGGRSYSLALYYLGQLYLNKGNRELAEKSFQLYLRETPNAANANQVRKMIAMLR